MKRHSYILLLLVLLLALGCKKDELPSADSPYIHFFGTEGDDLGMALAELADRSMAIAGTVHHEGFGSDAGLLLANADGSLQKPLITYGGVKDDRLYDMRLLHDQSGLILVGSTQNGDSAGWDALVIRTDLQGNLLWQRSFGGSGDEEAAAVAQCADGGFAVVGYSSSFIFGGNTADPQYYLLRLDASGNLLWHKGMGGAREDRARSVLVTATGDWVFCGITKTTTADYDASVTRISDQGDSIWTYEGISNFHDEGAGIIELRDGNFAWVGFTFQNGHDYNIVLEVIEPMGFRIPGKQWLSTGLDNDRVSCKRLFERADGSICLVGYTQSKGAGGNDVYFVITKPGDSGSSVDQAYGGNNDDIGSALVHTQDGGYAIAGYSKSFDFSDNHDILLMKVDSTGKFEAR
jgi:hypothetical protein